MPNPWLIGDSTKRENAGDVTERESRCRNEVEKAMERHVAERELHNTGSLGDYRERESRDYGRGRLRQTQNHSRLPLRQSKTYDDVSRKITTCIRSGEVP